MKKKLGIGSVSLLLAILGLLWSCNLPMLDGMCLGDHVLALLRLPTWSSDSTGMHYTVFYGLILYIPAFILGWKHKDHLFACSGKWISGRVGGYLLVMSFAILIWGQL